jgi:mycothiol system anti-sigma-R factor
MDCREFQKFVHLFLDGEFDERDRGEVEGHLRECPRCLEQARFEKWFREGVRRCLAQEEASPELRRRILAELERVQLAAPRSRILAVAATLLVGVLVAYLWSLTGFVPFDDDPSGARTAPRTGGASPQNPALAAVPPADSSAGAPFGAHLGPTRPGHGAAPLEAAEPPRRSLPSRRTSHRRPSRSAMSEDRPTDGPTVETSVASLAKADTSPTFEKAEAEPESRGERELSIELRSSDPDEVAAYLRARLARPVVVPTFQGKLTLVGATASPEEDSAQLVYRHGKQHLTLRVSARPDRSLPDQGIVVRQIGAHPTAMWRRSGFTFSVTSLLDPGDVVRLVASELHAQKEQEAQALKGRRLEQVLPAWVMPAPGHSSEAYPVSGTP